MNAAEQKLSVSQQRVIDALTKGQRLLAIEHTALESIFGGLLYSATLDQRVGSVHTTTLKSLINKELIVEKRRTLWQEGEAWKLYKLEYGLPAQGVSHARV